MRSSRPRRFRKPSEKRQVSASFLPVGRSAFGRLKKPAGRRESGFLSGPKSALPR